MHVWYFWDLNSLIRDRTRTACSGRRPDQWTAREVPGSVF